MATVYDMAGDTLVVSSIVTGVNTPGMAQIGNPNLVGMEVGAILFAYQTASGSGVIGAVNASGGGTALTTLYPVFNVSTLGAVTVSSNQTYMFEGMYTVSMATNNTHSYVVGFGGSATVASIGYQMYATTNTASGTAIANSVSVYVATTAASPATPAVTASAEVTNIFLNGIVTFNGGGTFIPQFAESVAGAATASVSAQNLTVSKGSYFGLWPVGNATSKTVGSWS